MTARVSQNLRSGFLHEELGVLLVRRVAIVAEVPRPDDIGVDAVATLLRPPVRTMQYADDATCYIQFKAKSVQSVDYNYDKHGKPAEMGHIDWLRELPLPFFVASVDEDDASVSLFTTQAAYVFLSSNRPVETMRLVFTKEDAEDDPLHPAIFVDKPIIRWSIQSAREKGFLQNAHAVLRSWIELERDNVLWRKLRYVQTAVWSTGQVPKRAGLFITTNPLGPFPSKAPLEALRTPLLCTAIDLLSKGEPEEVDLVKRVIELSRKHGVDPDEQHFLENFAPSLTQYQAFNRKHREKNKLQSSAAQMGNADAGGPGGPSPSGDGPTPQHANGEGD